MDRVAPGLEHPEARRARQPRRAATSCGRSRSRTCTAAAPRCFGLTVAGFEGCVQYGNGGHYHYTQKKASKLAKRLPAADILICHCPPLGVNDDPDDPAHVGFEGLRDWVDRHQPRHILHGHTHPIAGLAATSYGDARVHWVRARACFSSTEHQSAAKRASSSRISGSPIMS